MNADGAVTPAADLPDGLLVPEGPGGIEADVADALRDEIDAEADRLIQQARDDDPNAEIRRLIALADPAHPYTPGQPLRTIEDVNSAIAHMLMQPEPPPRPSTAEEEQRDRERIAESRVRMREHFLPLERLLLETFGSRAIVDAWLAAPNPVLAGETPSSYLQRGNEQAVRKLLLMAETGMPT